ncbi:hypothetical protein [Ferroplasma sp.]|uniref:hypothetical protein n=1 Tax=Ferroplasma sp. TaxID=2591003 RepID=UPI00307F57E3
MIKILSDDFDKYVKEMIEPDTPVNDKNNEIAEGNGEYLGNNFNTFPEEFQNKILVFLDRKILEFTPANNNDENGSMQELANMMSNYEAFAGAFGFSIGNNFENLTEILQDRIFGLVENNSEYPDSNFARYLGFNFGQRLDKIPEKLQDKILKHKAEDFFDGFEEGWQEAFDRFPVQTQNKISQFRNHLK